MKKRRLAALFLSAVMSAGMQRAGPMSSTESPISLTARDTARIHRDGLKNIDEVFSENG